ncbi:MAG TPA: glycosyltransferase, partial [Polyangiaceae bacterium]
MRLLVVVPAYNEERSLPRLLAELSDWAASEALSAIAARASQTPGPDTLELEVAVVDDASRDRTAH